ncbi:MAG: hypothetical protein AAFN38_24000, partial [Cyanobacteria bacterium J06560_5]
QRVSRLVRKTLPFSKKLENHIGAIWLFIHEYNCHIQDMLNQSANPSFFPCPLPKGTTIFSSLSRI